MAFSINRNRMRHLIVQYFLFLKLDTPYHFTIYLGSYLVIFFVSLPLDSITKSIKINHIINFKTLSFRFHSFSLNNSDTKSPNVYLYLSRNRHHYYMMVSLGWSIVPRPYYTVLSSHDQNDPQLKDKPGYFRNNNFISRYYSIPSSH